MAVFIKMETYTIESKTGILNLNKENDNGMKYEFARMDQGTLLKEVPLEPRAGFLAGVSQEVAASCVLPSLPNLTPNLVDSSRESKRIHQVMLLLGYRGIQLSILSHILLSTGKSERLIVSVTPSEIKALKGQTVNIDCSYQNEDGEQLRIKWGRKDSAQVLCDYTYNKNNIKYTLWHCIEHMNITVDLSTNSSSLTIYDLHLNDSSIYFCQISIEIPPPTLTVKGKGVLLKVEAQPTVQLIEKTQPYPNEWRELICTSLEFYPDDIQVSWFKNGQRITNGVKNGTLYTNSDGSFSITSALNLSVLEWNEGEMYSCQVNHSTLPAPITEMICLKKQETAQWNVVDSCRALIIVFFEDIDDEFEPPCLKSSDKATTRLHQNTLQETGRSNPQ
ncbi:uncharacterized protein LOC125457037 [Stegostoma tigrinum]|uniref:uncharacterized protein LOC125457037 n=1 Tax=Stegostoma tigrinum TaxID=3053191 RepID=UPI00286FE2D1|nr:uncharacterized protein LOC125457037 [Stegostoma tigrinum]